ncbi:MAG TPA: acetyl-CoA carboxylase biotin carboxyl carrier protein [Thermoanaerobaculia bacterium]|nr:acetyl-CoA carboxylase biotin carboxyl carrier protein [Thermoanaerobaculia bacterium]HXT50818.1 acetyl-CoA carboxylase biotin carboxyl carrier protein [Thermoanaerobaculia bacterium]
MLSFEQIKELIEMVAKHRLHGLELERSGFKLSISGEAAAAAAPPPRAATEAAPAAAAGAAAPAAAAGPASPAAPPPPAAEALPSNAHVVRSPIVGTFYAAPSPDAEPFVRVGDRVRVGQVLCIVEAMKLMNEIESDVAGTVLQISVKNAQPVEYGEPLFTIATD